ncbi:TIGD4 [Branchiostoma lanceolatum]|uniref:TIGD4 protein n=1 Tax=Branchiostoma lanceolatum TaxID=7740 RepID=A0A8J9YV45_BRALA|nr:TIGD4 [Branchiostoma lanceolatum]
MEPGWTRAQWKIGRRKIPDVTAGYTYAPEKIFNMYESGLFYRTATKRTLSVQGEQCAGGKQAKDRHVNVRSLPVTYRNNKTVWVTSDLFLEWLQTLDRKMHQQYRKILLFADNAPSHPGIGLENALLRHFRDDFGRHDMNFLGRKDSRFAKFRKALDARMKELAADGVGTERRQDDPLTQEDEDKLWTTTNAVPINLSPIDCFLFPQI